MEKLPYPVIQKVIDKLGEKGIEFCESVLEEKIEVIIDKIYNEEVKVQLLDEKKGKDLKELRAYIFKNQFQKTKKRWLDAIVKSLEQTGKGTKHTELLKELELAESILELHSGEKFQYVYEVGSIEELKNKRLDEVRLWSTDEDKNIIDYIYIKDKTKKQQIRALTIDISLLLTTLCTTELNKDGTVYLEYADKLEENAIFSVSKGKLKFSSKPIFIEGEEYYVNEYNPSPEYSLRTLVGKNAIEDGNYRSELLDETDEMIYHAIMGNRTLDFVTNRKIYVDLPAIMNQVYASKSSKLADIIERRIRKMSYLKFTAFSKEQKQDYVIFGLFDNVAKQTSPNGNIIFEITVNDVLHQELIGKQVTRIYKEVLNKLENRLAKTIIFSLQKERLRAHLKNSNEGIFSYEFFLFRMRFRSRSKKENYTMIEECLEEIKNHKVAIKGFKRIGSEFHVEFIPVSSYEIDDLLPVSKWNAPLLQENSTQQIEMRLG